jgi:hypothetical protein
VDQVLRCSPLGTVAAAAATVALLFPTVAQAAAASNAASGQEPFTPAFSGAVAFTGATTAQFQGSGLATLMGATTNSGIAISSPPAPGRPDGSYGLPNIHTETLAAANGDQLVLRMDDFACPIGSAIFHGFGNWVVTGGTGRFANTTGTGTDDGISNFQTNTFQFTLTGTLSNQ